MFDTNVVAKMSFSNESIYQPTTVNKNEIIDKNNSQCECLGENSKEIFYNAFAIVVLIMLFATLSYLYYVTNM
ncbi:PrGVORF117 [Pieris rapae granulovirus Wuhan]|uniref:PrGVORF117 n=2 Tax=Betabaculovirus arrapae TaxID=362830 RepID=D2J4T4_9BBAC|nr:PrGVORF117 [Betabaculovirus arrapae]ADO85546.1 unknown [Pieris rapae granulovirus]QNN89442.1 ORF117 [Pieris brassicae granulovirus]ACZ63603.1 PrGVORF117 [Betabaculovirus arrapae]AGS18871.1 hypothetical protein [Pieris rapae granulovirus]UOS85791.1 ORF117 [Pieris rapae granulovirus]